jgi:hypothetical protein
MVKKTPNRPSKRVQVRPVVASSITKKKFKPVVESSRRFDLTKSANPSIVIADLRRGSLDSLSLYLKQNKGIKDRVIALELRKLISGSRHRSSFRLLVVQHPDMAKSIGGRPPRKSEAISANEVALLARFDQILPVERKRILAKEVLAQEAGVSTSTIDRALRKRMALERQPLKGEAEDKHRNALLERRRLAMEKLAEGQSLD